MKNFFLLIYIFISISCASRKQRFTGHYTQKLNLNDLLWIGSPDKKEETKNYSKYILDVVNSKEAREKKPPFFYLKIKDKQLIHSFTKAHALKKTTKLE